MAFGWFQLSLTQSVAVEFGADAQETFGQFQLGLFQAEDQCCGLTGTGAPFRDVADECGLPH